MELYRKASELVEANIPFAMATIVEASGSTPRGKAKMLVTADGSCFGTVGGGLVEAKVIEEARKAIELGRSVMLDYALDNGKGGTSLPMECGGSMKVFVEAQGRRPRLVVAGGGHVGLAIARLASTVGFRVAVVDDRPDYAVPERFPMASELYVDADLGRAMESAPVDGETFVVIATHASDERALRHFAARECRYLGFLGSRRKAGSLLDALRAEGMAEDAVRRVRAPIGLDLGAETPEEIAVSVVAEMMAVASGRDGRPLSGREGELVAVGGSGRYAAAVIARLKAAGFRVVALAAASAAEPPPAGGVSAGGFTPRPARDAAEARALLSDGCVPALAGPTGQTLRALDASAYVDATLSGGASSPRRGMAPAVIALGPGFEAGGDVDAVVGTSPGSDLGRVLYRGTVAPAAGAGGAAVAPVCATSGAVAGTTSGAASATDGCASSSRADTDALAVAGGVLEALLALRRRAKKD